MSRISYLMTLTPLETWRILRHRLPGFRGGPSWTAAELLSSAKHSRGIRFAELLLRQEAVVRRTMDWKALDFGGQRVVEIGCGPLAGYGPLAIFLGAMRFESAEPEWNAELFFSKPVEDKYLRVFHSDLVGLYGPRLSFPDFKAALKTKLVIERCAFEKSQAAGPVDIVLSQSVLEHVFPLKDTITKLAAISGPGTRQLHLVDFGNHYPTANPFSGLYDQPAEDYIGSRGKAINCLRMSDIAALLKTHELDVAVIPSRVVAEGYSGHIHPWWRQRYSEDDLFTQLALVAGPTSSA